MICARCGAVNGDNAWRCVSCGVVIERPDDRPTRTVHIKTHLIPAIFASCFCCLIPGVIAIVFALQVDVKLAQGDLEAARRFSKWAGISAWVSIVLGAVIIATYIALVALGVVAGTFPQPQTAPPPRALHSST